MITSHTHLTKSFGSLSFCVVFFCGIQWIIVYHVHKFSKIVTTVIIPASKQHTNSITTLARRNFAFVIFRSEIWWHVPLPLTLFRGWLFHRWGFSSILYFHFFLPFTIWRGSTSERLTYYYNRFCGQQERPLADPFASSKISGTRREAKEYLRLRFRQSPLCQPSLGDL